MTKEEYETLSERLTKYIRLVDQYNVDFQTIFERICGFCYECSGISSIQRYGNRYLRGFRVKFADGWHADRCILTVESRNKKVTFHLTSPVDFYAEEKQ